MSFLSYYFKFSLILCSNCHIVLFYDTFSFHIRFHYKHDAEKQRQQELFSQISSFSLYTVSETFILIQQSLMTLFVFLKLDVYKNAFSCHLCYQVLLNKENKKRHCSKNHVSNFKHTVTVFIVAQSLLKNRFFF